MNVTRRIYFSTLSKKEIIEIKYGVKINILFHITPNVYVITSSGRDWYLRRLKLTADEFIKIITKDLECSCYSIETSYSDECQFVMFKKKEYINKGIGNLIEYLWSREGFNI